ncbi:MAG: hypothetical protein HQM08_16155 [Candidatus Riflebacteria bacterium]|nr:hypothetical protein [Candidatus Riflebacteria bacterium]
MLISVSREDPELSLQGYEIEAELKTDELGRIHLEMDDGEMLDNDDDFLSLCTIIDATMEEVQTLKTAGFDVKFKLDKELMLLRGFVSGRFEEKDC